MPMTGSEIAKNGFANEQDVADKFNNWQTDSDAQKWLKLMMYELSDIVTVHAEKIGQKGYKSDINVVIHITVVRKKKNLVTTENIQVKLVSGSSGFNQVEKKKVDQYIDKWHIKPEVVRLLKLYDGECPPYRPGTRDSRRMFVDEFTELEQEQLLSFLQKHIVMIISDVIRGRGRFAAEWTLVVNKTPHEYKWILMSVNEAISIYLDDCQASFSDKGNIKLGKITLQRKGGDNGADTANMLQFKANPLDLFTDETQSFTSNAP